MTLVDSFSAIIRRWFPRARAFMLFQFWIRTPYSRINSNIHYNVIYIHGNTHFSEGIHIFTVWIILVLGEKFISRCADLLWYIRRFVKKCTFTSKIVNLVSQKSCQGIDRSKSRQISWHFNLSTYFSRKLVNHIWP